MKFKESLDRKCGKWVLMEIDPPYCDVIIDRWQKFAGKEAVLDASGKTFQEMGGERLALGEGK